MVSAEFLITSLVVVLIPGTGVVYTISTGLFRGTRASLFASLGCTLGIVPHLLASLLGLAAILHMSALAFQALKYIGVAYLFYLAWSAWAAKGAARLEAEGNERGMMAVVLRAVMLNFLNPKLTLFFLAFMPQFIVVDAGAPVLQMLTLSVVFMAMTLVVFVVYGVVSAALRGYVLRSPSILGWLQRSFAAVFALLGVRLALADR